MQANPLALAPLALFLAIFVGSGLYFESQAVEFAFYQVQAPVAILPAIVLALWLARGPLNQRIERFVGGVGDPTIVTMCLIYLLAGAFAAVAKATGGVDATVNFGLSLIPAPLVLPGLFVITAFIATAMGTSMGTIAAVAPIAVGVADATGLELALCVGTVIGGAMFGDNLSVISDTTIAATRTQGCAMRDKFRMNLRIAAPAAALTLVWLFLQGESGGVPVSAEVPLLPVLPYVAVLLMALSGLNVMLVLFAGLLMAGGVGLWQVEDYSLVTLTQDIYAGYSGMQEILLLSLLIGGLGALMSSEGGLAFLSRCVDRLTRGLQQRGHQRRAGELGISGAVALTNLCTANNTVAILVSGQLARDLAGRHGVDPRRSASLLDIFSCVVQGLLPYGAQILLASSLAGLSPLVLAGSIHYCLLLGLVALIAIISGRPRA